MESQNSSANGLDANYRCMKLVDFSYPAFERVFPDTTTTTTTTDQHVVLTGSGTPKPSNSL